MQRGANGSIGARASLRHWRSVAESERRGLVFALRAPSAPMTQRSVSSGRAWVRTSPWSGRSACSGPARRGAFRAR
eukprot:1534224-Alexandrium_andersonii.AAC.1